jgi:hypothetical protein
MSEIEHFLPAEIPSIRKPLLHIYFINLICRYIKRPMDQTELLLNGTRETRIFMKKLLSEISKISIKSLQ